MLHECPLKGSLRLNLYRSNDRFFSNILLVNQTNYTKSNRHTVLNVSLIALYQHFLSPETEKFWKIITDNLYNLKATNCITWWFIKYVNNFFSVFVIVMNCSFTSFAWFIRNCLSVTFPSFYTVVEISELAARIFNNVQL